MPVDRQLRYASMFRGSTLAREPSDQVAIVTCMDCRIDPVAVFGLERGEAHVIRNAGGVVNDEVIRSLSISQHTLGTTGVLIVQHIGCGLEGLDDEEYLRLMDRTAGRRPTWQPGGFADAEASLRRSMEVVRNSPFLLVRDNVRGAILDTLNGGIREVV